MSAFFDKNGLIPWKRFWLLIAFEWQKSAILAPL